MYERELSIHELEREKRVITAWIRDVTGENRARLREIKRRLAELERICAQEETGCGDAQVTGGEVVASGMLE